MRHVTHLTGHDSVPGSGLNAAVVRVLRSERAAAGISLAVLSQRSRVPVVTVQRLMAGVRPLRLETLEALCAGLQVSPATVMAQALHAAEDGG